VTTRAWDELETAFAEERRLEECARLFEQQAQELGDERGDVATELWLRAAKLWRTRLHRRAEAQRAFERVLERAAGHKEAVESLVTLYEEAGEPRKLGGVLALQLEHSDDVATRRTRLLRLATLHARELGDAAGAFAWQLQAFDLDPTDGAVRAELERRAAASGSWPALIAHYERLCATRDDVDRVALLGTAAREKEALGDLDGALASWQALAALPEPPSLALAALVRIYESRGDWRALHDVHARKLVLAKQPGERRAIVSAMAQLAERQGDDERAIAAYRRLWDEFGADDATLEALERLYDRVGMLAQLEAVLVERLGLAGASSSRTPLTFRLAEVRRRLERVPEALALYAEVLDAEPQHAGAQAALESIADGSAHQLEAARLLEPIVRATSAFARLARVLAIRVEHASEPAEAVALLHEIAWLEERELGRPDDAFATLARALRTEPAHHPTFDELERLSAQTGDWQRLCALYKEVATRPLAIREHVEVRCRLGALYRDRLHDAERALATFRRVLDLAPDEARATRALDDLDAAAGRWTELGERLRASLGRSWDGERALRLAAILEAQPGDGAAAVEVYGELLQRAPDSAAAVAGLERLFAAGVARQQVAALLMPRYRQAGHAADLVRLWTAAYVDAPDGQPLDDLVALARSADAVEALRTALPAAIARAAASSTRAAIHWVLATLASERGDDVAAAASLRGLLVEDAGHHEALLALATLQLKLGDPDAARANLERAVALGDDPRALRALARLADDDGAIACWERLRKVQADDTEALAQLASLYERHERWPELADVLERHVAVANAEELPILVEQQALVFARLGLGDRAETAWRRLSELRPTAPEPLQALARRFRSEQRWNELAAILERLVELPLAPEEARSAAVELGRLESETLERPERAVAAWQRVLAVEPDADEALAALERLYARAERAGERRQLLQRRAEAALQKGRADAAALAAEAAVAAVTDGDPATAAVWYRRVLEREPLHAAAQAYLEEELRARAAWPELVALLRARAIHLFGAARGDALRAVAEIEEQQLGERGAAFATLLDAFDADGDWAAHGEELKRLAGAVDGWPILAAMLQARATAAPTAARPSLFVELGGVLELARQLPAAIEAYRAALALDERLVAAMECLTRVYRQTGQSALLDVLDRRAALTGDRDEQLALYRELAAGATRLERWARAVEAHRAAARLETKAPERAAELFAAGVICRDQLADVGEARGCFEAAIEAYVAEGSEPPENFAEALARLRGVKASAAEHN
jgi:tetratricopeptide (TPR) repeat protein